MNEKLLEEITKSARYIDSSNASFRENNMTNQLHGQYAISVHNLRKTEYNGEDFSISDAPQEGTKVRGVLLSNGNDAILTRDYKTLEITSNKLSFDSNSCWEDFPIIILHGKALEKLSNYHKDETRGIISQAEELAYYVGINMCHGLDEVQRKSKLNFCFFFPQAIGLKISELIKQGELINFLEIAFKDSEHKFKGNFGRSEVITNEVGIINSIKESLINKEKFFGHYDIHPKI